MNLKLSLWSGYFKYLKGWENREINESWAERRVIRYCKLVVPYITIKMSRAEIKTERRKNSALSGEKSGNEKVKF